MSYIEDCAARRIEEVDLPALRARLASFESEGRLQCCKAGGPWVDIIEDIIAGLRGSIAESEIDCKSLAEWRDAVGLLTVSRQGSQSAPSLMRAAQRIVTFHDAT